VKEFREDPIVRPHLNVWTEVQKWKKKCYGAPEKFKTIQKEVSKILQMMTTGATRRILPFYPA